MHTLKGFEAGLALAVGAGLFTACQDVAPTAPGSTKPPQPRSFTTVGAIQHPGEAAFEEISNAVPSFAGFFLDGENLVVYVTDLSQAQAAEAAVLRAVDELVPTADDPRLAYSQLLTRSVRYSFDQLRQWRDQIEQQVLFALPDAAWIDLDEVRNQVAVGLVDGSGQAALEEAVARLAVAPQAVRIQVTGRDVANETLLDRVRPVVGGLANAATFNGVPTAVPWCTYSFNAQYNGVDVILTASHCTSTTYHNDQTPTVFYQNSVTGADQIGSEWYDPSPQFYCSRPNDPFVFVPCRYSDAAMIRYDPGVSFNLGFIARTTSRSMTWGVNGSRTIDASNPTFRIIASRNYPIAGERVEKVGWRTGWTSGTVLSGGTCVDSYGSDDVWRLCTYRADYFSGGGDSGAPVFIWPGSGSNVTLVGIHWGNNVAQEYSNFSPMGGVYQDFGPMTAEKPLLSVEIGGPSLVSPPGTFTWEAFPSGGLASYSYKWWVHYFVSGVVDSLGTGKTQDLYIGEPICGNLEMGVKVTSGAETATDTHYVNTYTTGCGGGEAPRKLG